MAVRLSAEVIRVMGFRPFEHGESITASFSSISVYEARAMTLPAGTTEVTSGTIAGGNYRVGVGANLNDTCAALTNDVYVDDESEWKKEKNCSGPFVLIQLGPTQAYTITTGHIKKEEDGSTTTFESFPNKGSDLAALEATALPALVTSLTCLLGEPDIRVELRKVERAVAGLTSTGEVLHDIRVEFSATGHVSRSLSANQLAANLRAATGLAPRLNAKAAQFFALGLGEDDELKKFLYFFLAIEVQTHATFGRIDHSGVLQTLLAPSSLKQSTLALMQRQADQLRNLIDRFVWCSACVWFGIDDADVEQFKQLKKARDNIAHGSASEPPPGYAHLAQELARKLLRL